MLDRNPRLRRLATSLVVLAVVGSAVGCSAPSLRLTPRVAQIGLGGDFGASVGGTETPTTVDSLGLNEEETEFIPRADLEFGPLIWTLDYGSLAFTGLGTATAAITIDGVEIEANGEVASEIEMSLLRSIWTWDLFPGEAVELGIGFGVAVADVSVLLVDPNPDVGDASQASAEETVPLPFVALRGGVELGPVGLEALAAYMDVSVEDVDATYFDLDANAYWQFIDQAGVGARLVVGYRLIDVAASFDDGADVVDAQFDFSGPYVGISLTL
ncbi:hypothetical protein [Engelhardtia mirabilis]|uniref:Outer membrane protein beta-barrel domain-containing protein n=1 Tax=Engelhardtia mirabilis TaxID=2528011 RepID=A0A518BJZ5_9BACT|nr:hypothetical protein Pla133_23790 [Planctomycetes bacterium Pla133]QDV01626.1 hypothetical protein Pla86_23780 [Planctomycetes bacterium Pla86]